MNGREAGFLLLTSHLGDPERKVLTVAQLRNLAKRIVNAEQPAQVRDVTREDLLQLGYGKDMAERIVGLLDADQQLQWYINRGRRAGCVPVTRVSQGYPLRLRKRLGLDSPGCLWMKGELALLEKPMVSLVGSRDLRKENRDFAHEVGRQAALQGFTLVSGNARGADKTAQDACLAYGGSVISVVADRLDEQPVHERILYMAEDGYDLPFSSMRALSRNCVIHSLADAVLVAQCTYGKGGTWDGTLKNLRNGWSPVFCFRDGSAAVTELTQRGAVAVDAGQLARLQELRSEPNFFDQ